MEHLPTDLQNVFQSAGDALGLNPSFAAFVILQLLNIVIALLFRRIHSGPSRKIISLVVGLTWSYILYNAWNTVALAIFSGMFYILPVYNVTSPATVTMLAVAILSYFHIHRMVVDYMGWSLDVSGALMLFTAKFSMFAFDMADGRKMKEGKPLSAEPHIADSRKTTCMSSTPSMLEYYTYIFDFLGFIAGPVFHIREYLDFIYLRGDFDHLGKVHFARVVLERFFYALLIGGCFSVAGTIPMLSFDYVNTADYANMNLLFRLFNIHFLTAANRLKYYFAWYMSDVACLVSGIGYSPNMREKYSRGQNAILTKVELANSQSECMAHWNISISRWLRNCIYLRANEAALPGFLKGKIGHRQYATILTRFTSAFWHGFYPGYYLAFFSTVLQFEADSISRKYIKPYFMRDGDTKPHWFYTLCGKIHSGLCVNYYGAAFMVLSAEAGMQVWKSVYYIVHLFNVATIVLVPILFKHRKIATAVADERKKK